ncbi:hypothetical protein O5282_17990 [Escherichia coli]|nr:hypothetical protein [Escherichia coli]
MKNKLLTTVVWRRAAIKGQQASLQQAQSHSQQQKENNNSDELKLVLNERYSEIKNSTRWLEERDQELLSAESEQQTNETYRAQQQAWQEEEGRP